MLVIVASKSARKQFLQMALACLKWYPDGPTEICSRVQFHPWVNSLVVMTVEMGSTSGIFPIEGGRHIDWCGTVVYPHLA